MNLAVQKKSRRVPEAGDIFVMRIPDGHYLFGRVITTDANPLGVNAAILIYIYRVRSQAKAPIPTPTREHLLIPPVITNRQPWAKGYFELVGNMPVAPGDRISQHCFMDTRGWYFDERGNRLDGPISPVGQWGLHSYQTIDDAISTALGIPLCPGE